VGKAGRASGKKRQERFPWLVLLALLATVYLFWILPRQLGPQPVKVDFAPSTSASR